MFPMMPRVVLPFLFVSALLVKANKYTKEANEQLADIDGDPSAEQFRVQKLNFIWTKAVGKIGAADRKELLLQLKKADKQLLAAKYERDGGRDAQSIQTTKQVERDLESLLARFGLEDIYYAVSSGATDKKLDGQWSSDRNEPMGFKDRKLRRLWMDTVAEGVFDEDELAALQNEFQHHQRKLEEFDEMKENGQQGSDEKQNSVLREDYDDDFKSKSNAELKLKFKDIQRDYDALKRKVSDKVQKKSQDDTPISHPRVVPLLQKARSLYSGAELESIEEELRHFEARLKKMEYLKQEAVQGKAESDSSVKSKKEKSASIYDREMSEQLSDYSRKVEKYERYLASKLEL